MKFRLLRLIPTNIALAEKNGDAFRVGITLNISGSVITGYIISEDSFYKKDENSVLNSLLDQLNDLLEEPDSKESGEEEKRKIEKMSLEQLDNYLKNYKYLYLDDARYVHVNGTIPTNSGTSMCVVIDSIDSFSLGVMEVKAQK